MHRLPYLYISQICFQTVMHPLFICDKIQLYKIQEALCMASLIFEHLKKVYPKWSELHNIDIYLDQVLLYVNQLDS